MANYFSNHSQSRFLANSTTTSQQNSGPSQSPATPTTPRSRLPSKHFSTTVSTAVSSERSKENSPSTTSPNAVAVHPLRNTYVRILFRVNQSLALELCTDGYSGFVNNVHLGIKL
jgi:translation initiation factor 4E